MSQLHKFIFDGLPVRGMLVQLTDTWTEILRRRASNTQHGAYPAPLRDIPILIGGGGEKKTLRIVAEHADIWHSFSDPDTLIHKLKVLQHWCDEVGRDISEIELSSSTGRRDNGAIDVSLLEAHYDLGVRLFEISVADPAHDLTPVVELLRWRDSVRA